MREDRTQITTPHSSWHQPGTRAIAGLAPETVHGQQQRRGLFEILSALEAYGLDHPDTLAAEMNPIVYRADRGWIALDAKVHTRNTNDSHGAIGASGSVR